jgi:N6-adenosine-specific RNA methylase IME4
VGEYPVEEQDNLGEHQQVPANMDPATGEWLGSGPDAWADDEWEKFIREADPVTAILERARRIHEFREHCRRAHGKQGGSRFSEFMLARFRASRSVASQWDSIGRKADELFTISKQFASDWRAAYEYTALLRKNPEACVYLLEHYPEINQKAIAEVKRRFRAEPQAEPQPLGTDGVELAQVLYIDPPWQYEHVKTENRAIENQYDTMTLEKICELPMEEVAAEDCVLFMWATSPKLAEAFEVLRAWGFEYRTCAVWDKQRVGMGYYFRQRHELLLVATRGEPGAPAEDARPESIISIKRDNKHSKKPDEFYEIIEKMYPARAKREIFARQRRDGWLDPWGNQA